MPDKKRKKEIECVCETCGKIHLALSLGELLERIPDFDPKQTHYRHGMCGVCKSELESGCTFFCDSKDRVIKVSLEATKAKIDPAYHGRVVKIPCTALTELIRIYLRDQRPPPESGGPGSSRVDDDNG